MLSSNGKISEQQIQKMIASSVFLSGLFFVPHLAARFFGYDVIIGLLVFFIFSCLFFFYIYQMGERKKDNDSLIILIIQSVRLFVRLVFYVLFSIEILKEAQVPFMQSKEGNSIENVFVILPLLLLAGYGANVSYIEPKHKNEQDKKENKKREFIAIEKQGRLREIFFRSIYIPYFVMLFFGLQEVDFSIFIFQSREIVKILFYAYALLTFIVPVENYIWIRPFLVRKEEHKKQFRNRLFFMVIGSIFCIVLLIGILLGIYGIVGAAKEELLSVTIMRYIRFPFGILERFDVIMVWFFIIGCFLLICETLYFIGHHISKILKNVERIWILFGILVILLILLLCLPEYQNILILYIRYGVFVDIPLAVIIPFFEIKDLRKRKMEDKNDDKE